MRSAIVVSSVRYSRAPESDQRTGLLGWVAFCVDGRLQLAGLALRRTVAGKVTLAFPTRRDRAGREHVIVAPLDAQTRAEIEAQVLRALEEHGWRP